MYVSAACVSGIVDKLHSHRHIGTSWSYSTKGILPDGRAYFAALSRNNELAVSINVMGKVDGASHAKVEDSFELSYGKIVSLRVSSFYFPNSKKETAGERLNSDLELVLSSIN